MDFDVAAYRRAAGRLEKMEHDINPSIAAVLILQLCGEVERLQQHRCLWGNDPSGPHYSDEYLESLKTLSDTVAALPLSGPPAHGEATGKG